METHTQGSSASGEVFLQNVDRQVLISPDGKSQFYAWYVELMASFPEIWFFSSVNTTFNISFSKSIA